MLIQGQLNGEPASLSDSTAHEHAAAVRFDDMFYDSQADADALGFAAQFGAAPVKRLEDFPVFLRRNAVAAVRDPKSNRGPRCCRHLAGGALLRSVCRQDAGSTLRFMGP